MFGIHANSCSTYGALCFALMLQLTTFVADSRLLRTTPQALAKSSHITQRRALAKELQRGKAKNDTVEEYATNYHSELSSRSLIYFQHFSKTAGTMFCNTGRDNGCHSNPLDCHESFDYPHWIDSNYTKEWFDGYKIDTCNDLVARLVTKGKRTLEGNENHVHPAGICSQFWNVAILRDPIKRLMSHLNMLDDWKTDPAKGSYKLMDTVYDTFGSFVPGKFTPEDLFTKLPIMSNNYYVRHLVGLPIFLEKFGAVKNDHLAKAKRLLDSFDLVLVLDEDDTGSLTDEMSTLMGWSIKKQTSTGKASRDSKGGTGNYESKLNAAWNSAQLQQLRKANELDAQLYEYAKTLHDQDKIVFSHAAFSDALASSPKAKCGYLSK